MKRNRIMFMLPMLLALMLVFMGCGSDEESVRDSQCYTIRINGIDDKGIVSSSVINMPDNAPFVGYTVFLFDKTDLPNMEIVKDVEIDLILVSYKETPVAGFSTGETHFFFCNVNLCK